MSPKGGRESGLKPRGSGEVRSRKFLCLHIAWVQRWHTGVARRSRIVCPLAKQCFK